MISKGNALTDYEIINLVVQPYGGDAFCLSCDQKLLHTRANAVTSENHFSCDDDDCPRYGLSTILGVRLKSGKEEE